MKKYLIVIMIQLQAMFVSYSQTIQQATAGDFFQAYETQVSVGNYEKAFKYLKICDDMSLSSPLSSTALGIMYLLGSGIEKTDSAEVIIAFSSAVYFDYTNSNENRFNDEDFIRHIAEVGNQNADDAVSKHQNRMKNGLFQYERFMKLEDRQTKILQAFCCRWLACSDMFYLDEAVATDNIESKLLAASEGLENSMMADSLNSDAYAEYMLGKMYYEGSLGMRDRKLGIQYFEKSASKGCISALTYLGEIKAKSGETAAAKKLWLQASQQTIYPIVPLTKSNIDYFASPNLDLYDTQRMQLKALQYLK